MNTSIKEPRKRGPVAGPETQPYNVMLEPKYAEMAKREKGGLSELLRTMLRERYPELSKGNK